MIDIKQLIMKVLLGTQLLEVYALEIQMYTAQKNNKVQLYENTSIKLASFLFMT
jgi:hypothetical protein